MLEQPADAVVAAGSSNVAGDLLGMAKDRQPMLLLAIQHLFSCGLRYCSKTRSVNHLRQF
jgi:hypothetical protein